MRKLFLVALLVGVAFVARAADTTVTQSHTTFDVDSATLKTGETITFTNKDEVTHNIQIVNADGDVDDKGLQKPGQDIKETFAKAGTYKIRCAIHPKMKMVVSVQ
jgi:plastocyanin